jgi:hypothetical protein
VTISSSEYSFSESAMFLDVAGVCYFDFLKLISRDLSFVN